VIADNEHVLIVDDEVAIRLSLHRYFTRLGYRASVARNGHEALVVLREAPKVDVVITDLVMPELDGRELIAHLRRDYPETPVLIISGYPASLMPDPDPSGRPIPFLAKPFALDTLSSAVRRLLDQRIQNG
jgi:two-component system cell cycle sensor histidine kinase/response regulator CckA